jgi:phenylacetate-coenzyme A ligase PaaK-like adenylate-forming protein
MLIVRGVKVFPSSLQAVAAQFRPALTGAVAVRRPNKAGSVDGPLRVVCECLPGSESEALKEAFERRARDAIGVRVQSEFVQPGSLTTEGGQKGKWVLPDE